MFADFHQFYLQDEWVDGDLSDAWDEHAEQRLLDVALGVVGIGTVRNMDVPVCVEILTAAPALDLDAFDHVVECAPEVGSGRIVVAGCTDYFPDAKRIEVPAGTYRLRASFAGLDTLSSDGLDGEDRYRIQRWQAPAIAPMVLKQRPQ